MGIEFRAELNLKNNDNKMVKRYFTKINRIHFKIEGSWLLSDISPRI